MWRWCAGCAVVAALLLVAGCASDGDKHWYDDALKDLRGDNQQMHSFQGSEDRDN
jgi:hypothetical protein